MLKNLLKDRKIVLGSSSPRRQELLNSMGLHFTVRPPQVDEIYPKELVGSEISDFLAKLKADSLKDKLAEDEILITSDT
ncbi:MAG: Maf family protein, partial [Flavobacteriaceae bacterium]